MSRRGWIALNLTVDALALNVAIIIAFVLRLGWPIPQYNFSAYEYAAVFVTVGQLLILAAVDLYDPTANRSGPELFGTILKGIALGGLLMVTLTFFLRAFAFPRVVILLALLLQLGLLWSWRRLAAGVLHVRWPERRILLVGALKDSLEIASRLSGMRKWGYRVVGIVGPGGEEMAALPGGNGGCEQDGGYSADAVPEEGATPGEDGGFREGAGGRTAVRIAQETVAPAGGAALSLAPAPTATAVPLRKDDLASLGLLLQSLAELPAHLDDLRPHQIIFTTPAQHREVLEQVSLSRMFQGDIYVVPQLYEMHLGEVNFSLLGDMPLLKLNRASGPSWRQAAKVVCERLGAAVLLLVLSPLLLVISLALLLAAGRPVLFRQTRVGRDFQEFTLYKFRTMVREAEPNGAVMATADDPRVFPLGRFLRRSRLDELPQFYNVLRGDMSLVGPRPERPEFVEDFMRNDPLYRERFRVRPGITGLAQVSAPYETSATAKLRFDLMYIHHESMALDLRIILKTLRVILTGRGSR